MRPAFIWLCAFLWVPFYAGAGDFVFNYNNRCAAAYKAMMALQIPEARRLLFEEIRANPYNLMATYVADYEDCIYLLLTSDPAALEQRERHFARRLELIDRASQNDPWYRLAKSGIYLHWALVKMRFGDLYHESVYFRKSTLLLRENRKLFPTFAYNQVFSGLQQAVAGSLPDNLKWLASLFGMKGSIASGVEELDEFLRTHNEQQPLYEEAVLYGLFTKFYLLNAQKEAWGVLNSPAFSTQNNPLRTFVKVSLALDYKKSDAALKAVKESAGDALFQEYPIFWYQMGVTLYTRLDTNCRVYFRKYLAANRSELLIKDTWQKLSLSYYLGRDLPQAKACRVMAGKTGSARIDPDRQAEKFAAHEAWPDARLLQIRLMIEAGFTDRALNLLAALPVTDLPSPADRAEYDYRYGNACELTEDRKHALDWYQKAIDCGRERHEQFAARAALQMGRIYEQMGDYTKARNRYRECLDMPAHDFQNSLDHQAKAGLSRTKNN